MKRFVMKTILGIGICLSLTGCSGTNEDASEEPHFIFAEASRESTPEEIDWSVPAGARFVPVDNYTIADGSLNGINFITYVDLEDGCMYVQIEHFQAGYGLSFTKLTDKDNNACIYEDLESLREYYNYNVTE